MSKPSVLMIFTMSWLFSLACQHASKQGQSGTVGQPQSRSHARLSQARAITLRQTKANHQAPASIPVAKTDSDDFSLDSEQGAYASLRYYAEGFSRTLFQDIARDEDERNARMEAANTKNLAALFPEEDEADIATSHSFTPSPSPSLSSQPRINVPSLRLDILPPPASWPAYIRVRP